MEEKELELYLKKAKPADEGISSFTEAIGNVPTPWEKGDVITFPDTIKGNAFKTKIGVRKHEYIVVHVKSADGNERQANFFPSLFRRRIRRYTWDRVDGEVVNIPTNDFVAAGGSIVTEIYNKSRKVNDVVTAVLGKSIRISEVHVVLSLEFGSTNLENAKIYDFEPEGWTIGDAPVDTPEGATTDSDAIKNTYDNSVGNGHHNGHEWVDLGLSVKWATCNVGASSLDEDGDLFAWGEPETKETYNRSNSLTYGLSISELESQGFIDGKGNLTSSYDAATANWGGSWRMPTKSEMEELVNNCSWEWIINPCEMCCKVTGPNGNSIFLPYRNISTEVDYNKDGSYWSSTLYDDFYDYHHYGPYDLWIGCFSPYCPPFVDYASDRSNGNYVRPVLE